MEKLIGFPGIGIKPFLIDRVAFSIGDFDIYWYAIIIAIGIVLAVAFCLWQARKFDLTPDNVLDILLFGLPISVICARAYYVIFKLDSYDSFAEMVNIRDGGLAIYGGVIGAFVTGFVYCRIKKSNMLALFDLGSLGFLIGQAIGRWGNFVNAEAFGEKTSLPWGMTINGYGPFHPTFFYESIWNVIGFILLLVFAKKFIKYHGEVFFLYLSWYGFGRFFIEGLRVDSLYIGTLRVSQALAAILFFAGVVFFVLSRTDVICRWQKHIVVRAERKQEKYKPVYTPLFHSPQNALEENATEKLGDGQESEECIPREMENENG